MRTTLKLQDITVAKSRIENHVIETPILTSSILNSWLGHDFYFKAEGFQKIGAFKVRGACNTLSWLIENNKKPERVVANSSGNHAQAVAWAGNIFGVSSTIFMPDYSSKVKIQATISYGADVVLCKTRQEADHLVKEASQEKQAYWIPPYNHEQVICGQGTVAYEALQKLNDLDAIFAPCGGGGLLSGTLIASRGLSRKAQVIGAEPEIANDAARSIQSGTIQKLEQAPKTLADGAMTLSVGDITFEYLKQLDDFYEISERDMVYWTQWLSHLLKLRIEPTSALGMAAAFNWTKKQSGKKSVLIILSGANIDQATTNKIWETDYLDSILLNYKQ